MTDKKLRKLRREAQGDIKEALGEYLEMRQIMRKLAAVASAQK